MPSTYFRDAIAVFEGGGVRGIAYAGACQEADAQGVRFRGAVGTSVGAIAAALVAAGIRGERFGEILSTLPLDRFVSEPIKLPSFGARLARPFARVLLGSKGKHLIQAYYGLGKYSSQPIEDWLNEVLSTELKKSGPVTFSGLPYPLSVVAADLGRGEPRPWSTHSHPDDAVAFAVRCSCTVPFFFAPVEHQGAWLVDGGILSNLPIQELDKPPLQNHLPALAFRLVGDSAEQLEAGGDSLALLERLISTVVTGHTVMQLNQGPPCQLIEIPTGTVSTVDFGLNQESIDQLFTNGKRAMKTFLDDEQLQVANSGFLSEWLTVGWTANIYEQTMLEVKKARDEILVFGGDLSWVGRIWPAMLAAIIRKVQVRVLCGATAPYQRVAVLQAVGCTVQKTDCGYEVRGSLIDTNRSGGVAIVKNAHGVTGRVLTGNEAPLLKTLRDSFERLWTVQESQKPIEPCLERVQSEIVVDALRRRVRQYEHASIEFCSVAVHETTPLVHALETSKLRAVDFLVDSVYGEEFGLFEPLASGNGSLLIAPPVLERTGEHLIVVDGVHRLYWCLRNEVKHVEAVVVSGVSSMLPAALSKWEHVYPRPSSEDREDRYEKFNNAEWRHVKDAWNTVQDVIASGAS